MKKMLLITGLCVFVFLIILQPAFANKSAAALEGPKNVEKGSEVTIKINVTHNSNSFLHYTNWLKVAANGKLVEEWKYSMGNRPESANFSKEIKIKITEDTEIVAESNCNLHGSAGPAKLMIRVDDSKANP